jgi:hypothetical protein
LDPPRSNRPAATRQAPCGRGAGTLGLARRLWREAVPAAGTLVERYLRSRGLALPGDAPIRFHPRAWRNPICGSDAPAMLTLMNDAAAGEPVGTHVTYLRPDGGGKAGASARGSCSATRVLCGWCPTRR